MVKFQPLVSAIVPVYNGERYLSEAIESVLNQTYESIEIIVIDDGSTDSTATVAKTFSDLRYYYQVNRGIGAARNRGVELARGDFLAFLDADDVWVKEKLSLQVAAFQANPQLGIILGQFRHFHSPELPESVKNKIYCPPEPMPGYLPSVALIERKAFLRVGLFATEWRVGEFIEWYIRAMDLGLATRMLSEVVVKRRLHETNQGIRERQANVDFVRILKASLNRRRINDTLAHSKNTLQPPNL